MAQAETEQLIKQVHHDNHHHSQLIAVALTQALNKAQKTTNDKSTVMKMQRNRRRRFGRYHKQ